MRYCKLIASGLLCLGFATIGDSKIKADYFTDYNTTVTDTIFRESIFNFDIFNNNRKYSLPEIKNSVIQSSMEELEYNAELLSYKKNSYNYLIFYSLDSKNIPKEMFRIQLKKSGNGKIVDKSLLKLFSPNTRIIMNVMTYDIDNNGNIKNLEYSKSSKVYFTKKQINLVVSEGKKEVVNRIIEIRNVPQDDKISVYPYELEQYYTPDKYYSYKKASILIDGKELNSENIEVPYLAKKIEVKLAQDKEYWNKVTIEYPSELKKDKNEYLIKQGTTFFNFVKENEIKDVVAKNNNYEFSGYYLDDKELGNSQVLGNDIKIMAKYNTKIVLDNGVTKQETTLLTGQKLSEIDTKFFNKEKYHVDSYTIVDASDSSKTTNVKDLSELKVDNSVIIKANYKENVDTIKIRQDDYNKRFGKVDDSIKDKDIEWPETKKIGELLSELRKKIKPSTGYEVLFRSNKKVINDDEYITSETVLEIYFKKVGAVVTEKGKNIEFNAVYRKLFNVEFENTFAGSINFSKDSSNTLRVDEFNSIGDATKNNKIIVAPRSGYTLSHFIADKTVKVNMEKGTKEIFSGQKIKENELYNIVPTSDLKITPVFKLSVVPSSLEEMIENNKIKTVEDALDIKFESTENIRKILGPLYYLR